MLWFFTLVEHWLPTFCRGDDGHLARSSPPSPPTPPGNNPWNWMAWNHEQNIDSHIAEQPITTSCRWFMIVGQMLGGEINGIACCSGRVVLCGEEGFAGGLAPGPRNSIEQSRCTCRPPPASEMLPSLLPDYLLRCRLREPSSLTLHVQSHTFRSFSRKQKKRGNELIRKEKHRETARC